MDVSGIDHHKVPGLPIFQEGVIITTQDNQQLILIMNQYSHMPTGRTIHSVIQIDDFNNKVDCLSINIGGKQCLVTNYGYRIPFSIRVGLTSMPIKLFSDKKWETLPHVVITSNMVWHPSKYDNNGYHSISNIMDDLPLIQNDDMGYPTLVGLMYNETRVTDHVMEVCNTPSKPKNYQLEDLLHYFLRVPYHVVSKTLDSTTQYDRLGPVGDTIRHKYRSPFPYLNVECRFEKVSTDTVLCDNPSICDNYHDEQFYVGINTKM